MAKSIYTDNNELFLKVLARVRVDSGLSQSVLAKKMEMSQSSVSNFLRGQRRLDVVEWIRFCRVCGIEPEQFLGEMDHLAKNLG